MNSRESERSSSFAPTDRQGPKWPLHPRATGSGAPRSVPKCRQKRNVPICRLEGTEEDGVGSGFAELELVAGIELGGTAGLDLNADARGPVYHHGSVGGRQVLNVPDILVIAPHVGMASRNVIAHIGDAALPRCQRADLDAFLTRLNPARDAHRVAVLHAQQSQRMRRRDLVLARLGTKAGVRANGIGNESCGCTPRRQAGKPHEVTGEAQAARHHFQILTRASRSPVAEGSLPPKRGDSRCSPIALASFILLEVGYKNFPGERRRLVSFLSRGARL